MRLLPCPRSSPQSTQLRPNPWHGCQGRPSNLSSKESRQSPYKHAHRPTWATQSFINMFFWDNSRVCQPVLHSLSLIRSSGMILESVQLSVKTNPHKSCRNKLGTSRTHKQGPVLYNMTVNIWVWFLRWSRSRRQGTENKYKDRLVKISSI